MEMKSLRPRAARTHEICFSAMMHNIHSWEKRGGGVDILQRRGRFNNMVPKEDLSFTPNRPVHCNYTAF